MPSLRQLLVAYSPLLVIDASAAHVQVGWLTGPTAAGAHWATSTEEAGVAVFTCLERLAVSLDDAQAFAFCDGPGSILGIRTTAMAIRTWCVLRPRPVYAFSSLGSIAHFLARDDIAVIADARRDSWHHYQRTRGLRRVPTADLARDFTGELVTPEGFRNWTPLPPAVRRVPYALAEIFPRVVDVDLFQPCESPDAFMHEEPSYVTWTPQIHRAPQ